MEGARVGECGVIFRSPERSEDPYRYVALLVHLVNTQTRSSNPIHTLCVLREEWSLAALGTSENTKLAVRRWRRRIRIRQPNRGYSASDAGSDSSEAARHHCPAGGLFPPLHSS